MPERESLECLLECAGIAARAAGDHALKNRDRRRETLQVLKNDVKLVLDVECQRLAEGILRTRFPHHRILGEEDTGAAVQPPDLLSDYEWIIDPIDGTVNFFHGLPLWCCSIAVRRGQDILAGVVYAPEMGHFYEATAQSQARCNGQELRVSEIGTLEESVVMTGLDKNADPALPPLTLFSAISSRVQRARVLGSAALDVCMVAAGRAEGYFEAGIYIWDIAAAGLLVRQAGGKAEVLQRRPDGKRLAYAASNGRIHSALKEIVEPRLGGQDSTAGTRTNPLRS
jgi:myo-inositol-1(or 4)-monophosphatase